MDRNNKGKIKVVHLVEELTIGGLERVLTTIVSNLNKEKYNVFVWCLREGGFFADKLVKEGIESMSLNPDTVIKTTLLVNKVEKRK